MIAKFSDNNNIKNEFVYEDNLTSVERLKSMLLDHIILSFTILPFIMIALLLIDPGMQNSRLNDTMILLIFGIYLNKDMLRGRSVAKRILGQVVIDKKTGKPANEIKCVVRNFTDILWIIEVIIILFNPNRRIGDMIANTKVVRVPKEAINDMLKDLQTVNKLKGILSGLLAITYIWFVFNYLLPKTNF